MTTGDSTDNTRSQILFTPLQTKKKLANLKDKTIPKMMEVTGASLKEKRVEGEETCVNLPTL